MNNITPIRPRPQRRAASYGITVAQYREIMDAIRALPDEIAETLERRGNVPLAADYDFPTQPSPSSWDH